MVLHRCCCNIRLSGAGLQGLSRGSASVCFGLVWGELLLVCGEEYVLVWLSWPARICVVL